MEEAAERQAAITAATTALFDAVDLDSSGQATVQALMEVLQSGQQGEWTAFANTFTEQLQAVAPEPAPNKTVDIDMRAMIQQAADRNVRSTDPAVLDSDSDTESDDGVSLQQSSKVDLDTFMQMVVAAHADGSA